MRPTRFAHFLFGRTGAKAIIAAAGTSLLAAMACSAAYLDERSLATPIDYARDIRPLLAEKCFACHGADEKARKAGLRLDLRDGALRKSAAGIAAIAPRNPSTSGVVDRITATDGRRMPPAAAGHRLEAKQIALIKRWISQGAEYTMHWAFIKPLRPAIPTLRDPNFVIRNPIDAFVLERLLKAGLKPNPPADRYTLIRRVSLDLIGLPPTPAEVDAFVKDPSGSAYEKLVDRLLASPRFGERWARMWLDLARFADSSGYGSDPLRPNLWPWRDWVIGAFNANMPYDQFTLEQIAGDLLPSATTDQIIATAFHRNTMTNTEGGTDREEFRTAAVKDRTITTAQVWMGLTVQCAQCHSHKFDPISRQEFYRLYACFNQTEDADRPDEQPTLPIPSPKQDARKAELDKEIAALEPQVAGKPELKAQIEARRSERARLVPVALPIMRELPTDKRRSTHVLTLGNFLLKEDTVEPGTPAAFHPFPPGAPQNRLGVAGWLVSPDNPLTARVAVNRFWSQLFGRGIVETEEDFGTQGTLPSHPELLDWLAVEFASGSQGSTQNASRKGPEAGSKSPASTGPQPSGAWDVKRLLKLLVTSGTYMQSSLVTPRHLDKDPRNTLLARYPRRRLEAEMVRDQALAISGLLSAKIGGASVYPPQPDGLWRAAFNGDRTWPTSTGEDRYRRALYTFWRRTIPYPSLATFDAPSREICTVRRIHTNTPLQALITLNDPAYMEMAQALGRRIVKDGGETTAARAKFALRLVLARPPSEAQARTVVSLFEEQLAKYRAAPADAKALATEPLGPLPGGMNDGEQAAWTVIANVLLNLDGALTKN